MMDKVAYGAAKMDDIKPVFTRELRHRRMNVLAMIAAVVIPWLLFIVVFFAFSFSLHYQRPYTTWFIFLMGLGVVASFALLSLSYRWTYQTQATASTHVDPAWYTFLAVTCALGLVLGLGFGDINFYSNTTPSFDLASLNTYPSVDVSKTRGQQAMDGGLVNFIQGTTLALNMSSAFRNERVYCVAPITVGNTKLETYDFWAVGVDCCSGVYNDFRCGEWDNARARGGMRMMKDFDRAFYRLAVQQAEATYKINADHPLFFTWVEDPIELNQGLQQRATDWFVMGAVGFFLLMMFFAAGASLVYAKITP